MKSPILNEVGTIFIPVSNIETSRDWYCRILGLPVAGEIKFGHLYVLPLKEVNIVLDSKIYEPDKIFKTPAFHFNTNDIVEAFEFLLKENVNIVTDIQFDHYFNFKDPDGNLLMVCKC